MSDFLLLAGIALCLLSVPLAIVAMLATRAPRGAAAAFVLGVMLIGFGAWASPDGFRVQDIGEAWGRLTLRGN